METLTNFITTTILQPPPTFRDSLSVPYSRVKQWAAWYLNMESIICPETSVTNYQPTRCVTSQKTEDATRRKVKYDAKCAPRFKF